jgi:hypothetical protein
VAHGDSVQICLTVQYIYKIHYFLFITGNIKNKQTEIPPSYFRSLKVLFPIAKVTVLPKWTLPDAYCRTSLRHGSNGEKPHAQETGPLGCPKAQLTGTSLGPAGAQQALRKQCRGVPFLGRPHFLLALHPYTKSSPSQEGHTYITVCKRHFQAPAGTTWTCGQGVGNARWEDSEGSYQLATSAVGMGQAEEPTMPGHCCL